PSGADFAMSAAPMVPPAPPLFSTSTGWPSVSLMRWPIRRATMSVVPPAGNGTTTRIGLDGNDWASALPATMLNSRTSDLMSAPDLAAVVLRDRDHRAARRHARLEVGPARRRVVEGRALVVARVLDREEQRLAVGREAGSAHLAAGGPVEDRARPAAIGPAYVRAVAAVVEAGPVVLAVGRDPDAPLRVERHVVGRGEPAVVAHRVGIARAVLGHLRVAAEQEEAPVALGGGVVGLAVHQRRHDLDDVAVLVRPAR